MRRAIAVLLPLSLVLLLTLWRAQGPAPRPAAAPATEFSADRAMTNLRTLLSEGIPHPIGTPANARVRDRVLAQFQKLGYETEVQRRFACNAGATCGMVENIIARQPGARRKDAVALTAHYDSVPAGEGASDDGVGTAALLEVARAVRAERYRNPIVFLITDGEEAGLLGAEAFIADEALSAEVKAVVNVEMRGTYGPSNMFETSRGNRWLAPLLAEGLARPQATSFFYAIYELLPNDTDVTIFKRGGKAAVNFAAIRGVNWYHTPLDDLAHVSSRTLQHHGDNLLGTARALAATDLDARSSTDATYFDVLSLFLVWWPQPWTIWIAIVSLALLIVGARRTAPREMTFGVLTAFTGIIAAALLGFGTSWLARLKTSAIPFVASPEVAVAAMWLAGVTAALLAATLFRKRAQPLAMLYGVAIVWHMIGIAVAVALPGAAFLFILPGIAVTLCALARAGETVTAAVASTVAAVLFFPMALMLYDALGGPLMVVVAVLIGTMATLAAPLFPGFRLVLVSLVATLALAIVALFQPGYDAANPQRVSLTFVDDTAAPSPQWIVSRVPPQLARVAAFQDADAALTPWSRARPQAAKAPPSADLQRVELTAEREDEMLTVRVRTRRGGNRLALLLKGDLRVVSVNGVRPPPRPARFQRRMPAGWEYASAAGVAEMVVVCEARGPVEAVASDITFTLPPSAAPLVQARNATPAIPIQDGDATITRARAKL